MRWIRPRWRDLAWPPQPFERFDDLRPLFNLPIIMFATASARGPGPFLAHRWTLVAMAILAALAMGWWLREQRRLTRRLGGRTQRTLLRTGLKEGQLPEDAAGERWLPHLGGLLLGWSATMNRNLWLVAGSYTAPFLVDALRVDSSGAASAVFGLSLVGGVVAGGLAAPYERRRIQHAKSLRQQIVTQQRAPSS